MWANMKSFGQNAKVSFNGNNSIRISPGLHKALDNTQWPLKSRPTKRHKEL